MAKLTSFNMWVDCENDAFKDDATNELWRLLDEVKVKLYSGMYSGSLKDQNGNRVGHYVAERDDGHGSTRTSPL